MTKRTKHNPHKGQNTMKSTMLTPNQKRIDSVGYDVYYKKLSGKISKKLFYAGQTVLVLSEAFCWSLAEILVSQTTRRLVYLKTTKI